ncbi:MAG: hypothetical protein ACW98K_13345 [Candidatus Kariarchaeaceae archaeon]|jgi:hypothetical protein
MVRPNAEEEYPSIVLIGEIRQGTPAWNLPFDPTYTYTDGLLRSLFMRLNRLMRMSGFQMNHVHELGSGEKVFLTSQSIIDSATLFCYVLREGDFDNQLIGSIQNVAGRGGVYTAKKFYYEVRELISAPVEEVIVETLLPTEAFEYVHTRNWDQISIEEMASLLVIIGMDSACVKGDTLLEFTLHMLSSIPEDLDADVMLDSAFVIASKYLENQKFVYSSLLFEKIAKRASEAERLALEIACLIRSARILKLRGEDDPMAYIDVLSPIDDGSLEVASNNDREEYYCLQGHAFALMGDPVTAEDLYTMAILISEPESFPTMNKAEAHGFIGEQAGNKFHPEISTREYITASAIATRNGLPDMTAFYAHLAARQEIVWARFLASSALIRRMESDFDRSDYEAWQGLKRLVNAFVHADPNQRKQDLGIAYKEILKMTESILTSRHDEYAIETIKDIRNNLITILDENLPEENEKEVLKFLASKISVMIPLPTPIIMLIAHDGRLIAGGEIGIEKWDEAISDHDELFSGALSAIMAVLSEVTASDTPLRMVDAGTTQIMIEKSKVCIGALLVDRDLNAIRKALQKVVGTMEIEFPELRNWDGFSVDLTTIKPMVDDVFAEALKEIER